jgi:hypothetical protein
MADLRNILSLGAGVQSSTLALMAATGEVPGYPHLDAAIFADTQAEPDSVYLWLDWLETEIARSPFPYPVYRVTAGSLRDEALKTRVTKDGRKYYRTNIPFFTLNANGTSGKITFRSCTMDYKIKPILKLGRRFGEIKRGQKTVGIRQWIGISLDEAHRMKPSRAPWIENTWPLIDLRMRRADCLRWMESHCYPKPPRSACGFCPFHNDHEWRRLKLEEPEAFAAAVDFEARLQSAKAHSDNMNSIPFLHRKLKPLSEIDFSNAEDRGQADMWGNECEGMCGV